MEQKCTTAKLLRIVAVLEAIFGIIAFIAGLSESGGHRHDESTLSIISGIGLIISSFFTYGFSYVVAAAYKYLNTTTGQESNSSSDNKKPSVSRTSESLQESRISKLKESVKAGKISPEEYDEIVRKIRKRN